MARAEPGSLAELITSTPASPGTQALQQIPQWLFAFDAAGMATFRALALLDAHPEVARRARAEEFPFALLRATVLESVRLWPTTPAILRDATAPVAFDSGVLPARAALVILAPFFHRDGERLEFADRFAPELWVAGAPERDWPLVPFSAGPAECAGRNLVLLVTSALLAALLAESDLRQAHPQPLDAGQALPATLSPFRLRFARRRR